MKHLIGFFLLSIVILVTGNGFGETVPGKLDCYRLGPEAQGCVELVDHIRNLTVVSKHTNPLKAEYRAGFIQGKLQRGMVTATRDNLWDLSYLVDPSHSFPRQIPPSRKELLRARQLLIANYIYTTNRIKGMTDPKFSARYKRVLFRLLGLYHGTRFDHPQHLDFSGKWLPDVSTFPASELELDYGTPRATFLDIYYINAYNDLSDMITYQPGNRVANHVSKCSAFVKRIRDKDIVIAHNSWTGYLDMSMVMNIFVNADFFSVNALTPALITSTTDFGFTNKGLLFNETTHHQTYTKPKVNALWMFWRAAVAEEFASSLNEFFRYVSIEPSGTYMNGYMVVDSKTGEFGLVEMSYKSFVFFSPKEGGGYTVTTKPDGLSTEYDAELLTTDYILGINYPVSGQIREDLLALDTRPARRVQFLAGIGGVNGPDSAKALITYTDPQNPLSIYGRWDLGYGETPTPKTVPDGSIDAKVAMASLVAPAMKLKGELNLSSPLKGFWMKFGTPCVNGLPFIWSLSQWSAQKLRGVPDVVDGRFHYLNLYLK